MSKANPSSEQEKIEAALRADEAMRSEPPQEGWGPGRSPEKEAELDEAARVTSELEQDQLSSHDAAKRIKLLEEQLQETMHYVRELAAKGLGGEAITDSANEQTRMQQRFQYYEAIRKRTGGLVTIQLHTSEDPARNFPVPVCLNGQTFRLERGRPLRVPVEIMEVLDEARVQGYAKQVNTQGNPQTTRYDYLSYPYSVLDEGVIEARPVLPSAGP